MINVCFLDISNVDEKTYLLFRYMVSEERRNRADRYYAINDSKRSVCSELLLRFIIYQHTGQLLKINLKAGEFGKPFIDYIENFYFNIAHSGKWVVIAYGTDEIGIDIEKIQTEKRKIISRCFTKEEKNYIYEVAGIERKKDLSRFGL